MVFGKERLFKTYAQLKYKCEYLRFIGKDTAELKMHGVFPNIWNILNSISLKKPF
jgi:hypothetical protein